MEGTNMKKMSNKSDRCECGSGLMPTIMVLSDSRWACLECEHGLEHRCQEGACPNVVYPGSRWCEQHRGRKRYEWETGNVQDLPDEGDEAPD